MPLLTMRNREHVLGLFPWREGCGRDDPASYHLTLTKGELTIYDAVHSVANWQQGHFYVWRICNAFRRCRGLLGKDVGFNLYSADHDDCDSQESARVWVDTDWLGFSLEAGIKISRKQPQVEREERLFGQAFLRQDSDKSSGTDTMIMLRFPCPIADAVAFGNELYQECAAAAIERYRLYGREAEYDPFLPEDETY